jgi:hypothetical protein
LKLSAKQDVRTKPPITRCLCPSITSRLVTRKTKNRVVAEAAAQFESWKLEVARTISTTKIETKVTVLTRVSVHPIKARFVTKFIAQQEEIAGLGTATGRAKQRRTRTPPLISSNWHSLSLTN